MTTALKPTLAELEAAERDTKYEWQKAVRELGAAKERAEKLAESHTRAQRAVIEELQRQVAEAEGLR